MIVFKLRIGYIANMATRLHRHSATPLERMRERRKGAAEQFDVRASFERTMREYPLTMAKLAE